MKLKDWDWEGLLSLVGVVAGTIALGYFFVWNSSDLIGNAIAFLALVVVLIILSFALTAVEAGFSIAGKNRDVTDQLSNLIVNSAKEVAAADAEVAQAAIDTSTKARRKQKSTFRAFKRLKRKERNLIGSGRIRVVGALSALNVIINTALVTFLPTFLLRPAPAADGNAAALLPPDKLLILVASALPILYFGKIIPKMVGLQHSYGWGYDLYWVGNVADRLLGWIPRGLHYGLVKLGWLRPDA